MLLAAVGRVALRQIRNELLGHDPFPALSTHHRQAPTPMPVQLNRLRIPRISPATAIPRPFNSSAVRLRRCRTDHAGDDRENSRHERQASRQFITRPATAAALVRGGRNCGGYGGLPGMAQTAASGHARGNYNRVTSCELRVKCRPQSCSCTINTNHHVTPSPQIAIGVADGWVAAISTTPLCWRMPVSGASHSAGRRIRRSRSATSAPWKSVLRGTGTIRDRLALANCDALLGPAIQFDHRVPGITGRIPAERPPAPSSRGMGEPD